MSDFFIVIGFGILGLLAHSATNKRWLEWILRSVIFFWCVGEAFYLYYSTNGTAPADWPLFDGWVLGVTVSTCALTGLTLLRIFRQSLSHLLTGLDCLFSWPFIREFFKTPKDLKGEFLKNKVFNCDSIPHMVGLFILIQTAYTLLQAMSPKTDFQLPGMPISLPLPLDQLFSYNGLGLVMLSMGGVGIFVARNFKQVCERLGWRRPSGVQVGIGFGLIVMSFLYDYLWSLITHGMGQGLDSKLALYNSGTFSVEGGFAPSVVLALATALFAGIGEETLIRGALQPVFGIVPAAVLHGVLHAQFQHAPIFIVQVAGWSILMGIAKKYTNTTTTIIGHAGYNFITSFLFAFNI